MPIKKTVTKVARPKKALVVHKAKSGNICMSVSAVEAFYTIDGQVFPSLVALQKGLETMENRVYQYHADPKHQDFAKWIAAIFGDKTLAATIKNAPTAKAAAKALAPHLVHCVE